MISYIPTHSHTKKKKKGQKVFWLLYFVYNTSLVNRGWWGFFAVYVGAAKTYQKDSLWNWNFLCNTGKKYCTGNSSAGYPQITPVSLGIGLYLQRKPCLSYHSSSVFASSVVLPEMNCLVFLWWGGLSICNPVESAWGCCQTWLQMSRKPRKGSALRIDLSHSFCCWHKYAQLLQTWLSLKIPTTYETVSHRVAEVYNSAIGGQISVRNKTKMLNLNIQTLEAFGFSALKYRVVLSFNTCLKQVPAISPPFAKSLLFPFLLQYKKICILGRNYPGSHCTWGLGNLNRALQFYSLSHYTDLKKNLKLLFELEVDWILYNNDKGAEIRLEQIFPMKMQD